MTRDELRELYAASYRRLIQHVFAATGDLAATIDAVNAAFVRALARPALLDDTGDPETWIRLTALRQLTGRGWLPQLLVRRPRTPPASPTGDDDAARLFAKLRALPRELREPLVLCRLAHHASAAVALALELGEADIRPLLERADRQLDRLLAASAPSLGQAGWAAAESALEAATAGPGFAALHARARRQRLRRTAVAASAAAVLVAAVAVPSIVVRRSPPAHGQTARTSAALTGTHFLHGVSFSDPRHGFALASGCTDEAKSLSCSDSEVLVTADAGQSWHLAAAPHLTPFEPYDVRALGARTAVIVDSTGHPLLRTTDDGRSWRALSRSWAGDRIVHQVPDGWWLEVTGPHLRSERQNWQDLAVLDPRTGRHVTLSAYTGVDQPTDVFQPTPQTIWLTGLDRRDRPQVAVSYDAGLHWRSAALPANGPQDWVFFLDVHSPYVLVGGWRGVDRRNGRPADSVWLSTDLGATWRAEPGLLKADEPFHFPQCTVLADGAIVEALGDGSVRITDDSGRSWRQPADPLPPLLSMHRIAGTDVLYGTADPGRLAMSTDGGLHWVVRPVR